MTGRIFLILTLSTMLLISSQMFSSKASPPEYDLIIQNGRVIDGSGRPAFVADVAIKGDRIARIGNLRRARDGGDAQARFPASDNMRSSAAIGTRSRLPILMTGNSPRRAAS